MIFIFLFFILILLICIYIIATCYKICNRNDSDLKGLKRISLFRNFIFCDKEGNKIDISEIFYVEGNKLAYRKIYDGNFVWVKKGEPFKKRDIILTNDGGLFEVKTIHKDGTITLVKEGVSIRVDKNIIYGKVKATFII